MAKLVVVLLIASTVLSVISLPITGDAETDILASCYNNPHVLYPTDDDKYRCHKCHPCPIAMGMSILCKGQRVNRGENIECMYCVMGSNYSNVDDYSQCIPCPKMCKDQEVKGECAKDGDNRECVPCKKDWYYDQTNKTCKACSCRNMTEEAKRSCFDLGFNFELHCQNPNQSAPGSGPGGKSKKRMGIGIIILIIITVLALLIALSCYCCCVARRLKKFYVTESRWPLGVEWMYSIFCFHHSIANPVCCSSDEHQDTANGAEPRSKPCFNRQSSCPVTSNETKSVRERAKPLGYYRIAESDSQESTPLVRPRDCAKEKIQVHHLNVEVSERMYRLLSNVKLDLGHGYKTLAGRLGYTTEELDQFESAENPPESLLRRWSRTDVTNNVVKLKEILKDMERGDIVKLLEDALEKVECRCAKCDHVTA